MRATTIRFTPDLWRLLEHEAQRDGVSVARYVREAALFRIAHMPSVRGEAHRPVQRVGRHVTSESNGRP
jgi:hypothetical protein